MPNSAPAFLISRRLVCCIQFPRCGMRELDPAPQCSLGAHRQLPSPQIPRGPVRCYFISIGNWDSRTAEAYLAIEGAGMELQLTGKRALITGGSKGIGRGVAELLAKEGCHLRLAARTQADLEKAKRELEHAHSVEVAIHPTDLSESENCRALAKASEGIDILVNCAGAIRAGSIDMVDEQTWLEGWNLKLFGCINLTREIYPAMCRRG